MEEVTRVRKELARGSGSLIPEFIRSMGMHEHYINSQPPDTLYINDMHRDLRLEMLELDMAHRILNGANAMLNNRAAIDAIIDTVAKASTRMKTGIVAPESEWHRLVQLIKHERILPQSNVADADIAPSTRSDNQTVYVMGLEKPFIHAGKKWLEAKGHDIIVLLVPPMEADSGDTNSSKREVLRKTMVCLDSGYAYINGTDIIRLKEVGKPKIIVLSTEVVSVGPTDMTWIDAKDLNFRSLARPGARFEVDMNVSTTVHAHRVTQPTYPDVYTIDPEIVHVMTAGSDDHLNTNRIRAIRSPGSKQENCSHVSNTILNALSLSGEGQPLIISTPTQYYHFITDSVKKWSEFHKLLTVSVGIDNVEYAFDSAWNADIVIVVAQTSSGDTLNQVRRGHKLDRILTVLSNGYMIKNDGRARMRERMNRPMLLVLRDFELHPIAPIKDLYYQGHEIVELRVPCHMYCMNKCEEEMEYQPGDQNDRRADQNCDRDSEREHSDSEYPDSDSDSDDSDDKRDSYHDPNGWFSGAKNKRDDTESQTSETRTHQFSEPLHIDDMHMRYVDRESLVRRPIGPRVSTCGCKRKTTETISTKSTKVSKDADES